MPSHRRRFSKTPPDQAGLSRGGRPALVAAPALATRHEASGRCADGRGGSYGWSRALPVPDHRSLILNVGQLSS